MADRICTACGAPNPPTAKFCTICDAYIDWGDAAAPDPAPDPAPGPTHGAATEDSTSRREPHAEIPVVSVGDEDVVVTPGTPGTTTLTVTNRSDIVDGVVVHPESPPSWLVVTQDEVRLMPRESGTVVVTFAARTDALVVAQEQSLVLLVRSSIDVAKLARVTVHLTVPPVGPPPTMTPRPALVHLEDETEGGFTVSLDNREANFPRRYRLSVHDPEDVVRARFLPPVVDVPAGEAVDATVQFTAPAPDAGREVVRQLTISAAGDDAPVSATVTLTQRTAAPPSHVPVVVRLEPSHLRTSDGQIVSFDVLIDNRAGHTDAAVRLVGRDPQRLVGLSFKASELVVLAGTVATVPARAQTSPPPPGTTQSRPFTVVAADGTSEVEAGGVLDVSSRAAPITTARLRVEPSTLATQRRHGEYLVHIDNRDGKDVLQVQLAGADEFGRARLAFTPPAVAVPPGHVGTARLGVDSEPPPAGKTSTRRLRISASDGRQAVEIEAVLTQSTPDRRPVAKRWLVLLGAILAIVGALVPWFDSGIDPNTIAANATDAFEGNQDAYDETASAGSTALVILFSLLMVLGLNGSSGRGIRFFALLIAIVAVGAVVAGAPAAGLVVVLLGAVLGFIGGVLARSSAAR